MLNQLVLRRRLKKVSFFCLYALLLNLLIHIGFSVLCYVRKVSVTITYNIIANASTPEKINVFNDKQLVIIK